MPDMDGWAVSTKADAQLCDIPVVMLTIVDDRKRGFTLGAFDYATKPVDRHRLSRILKKHTCPAPLPGPPRRGRSRVPPGDVRDSGKKGWRVSEAKNGCVALECMERDRPSLILLDLIVAETDGFEFVARVAKHLDERRSIPIVVLTDHDLSSAERLRLNGFVEKILPKEEDDSCEVLLQEVRDLLADYTAPCQASLAGPEGGGQTRGVRLTSRRYVACFSQCHAQDSPGRRQ